MLISTILSPDILLAEHFKDPLYQLNAEQLLKGILSNGMMIVDRQESLKNQLIDNAESLLSIGGGHEANILLQAILTKDSIEGTRRVIVSDYGTVVGRKVIEVLRELEGDCKPDCIMVAGKELDPAKDKKEGILLVNDYIRSPLESKRRTYAETDFDSCDKMTDSEFDEVIGRACRFTKKLRFYDKFIGTGIRNEEFRWGVGRVVEAWLNMAYFPKTQLSAEIYTVSHKPSEPLNLSVNEAHDRVRDIICDTLTDYFGIPFGLHFKFDKTGKSHPRHLQTDSCTIQFERGFDFADEYSNIRRSFINHVPKGDSHLEEYRKLPYDFRIRR